MENEKKPKATKETLRVLNEMIDKAEAAIGNGLWDEVNELIDKYDWHDRIFEKDGKKGVTNAFGDMLVPAMFDEIAYTYNYLACGPKSSYVVMNGGKMGLVTADGTGKMLQPCEYEIICLISSGYALAVKKDGKYGVMAWNGYLYTPIDNDKLFDYDMGHYIILEKDGKKGLCSVFSCTYVKPEYDDIDWDGIDTPFKFIRDGKTFYIDTDENVYEEGQEEDSEYLLLGYQDQTD